MPMVNLATRTVLVVTTPSSVPATAALGSPVLEQGRVVALLSEIRKTVSQDLSAELSPLSAAGRS